MKRITHYIKTILITAGLIALPLATTPVSAVDVFSGGCGATGGSGALCGAATSGNETFQKLMQKVINTILLVLGIIAVIMIVVGGIRYVTSNGDSSQISSAKDTILYAVIGLIVAIMAYAIVGFVISRFKS